MHYTATHRTFIGLFAGVLMAPGLPGCDQSSTSPQPERVESVTSTKVMKETIPDTVPGVGSIRAIEISTMAPEVAGNVIGRYFEDGQRVSRGDILYTLDRRTQEAQLESTKAQLAEQQWVWERMKILAETQAASDAEVAETAYNIESLTAQVAELQSVVDKLTILAPYDGQVAIHMIDVGTYADVGDELVTVVNDSVMLVDYDLATNWLPKLKVGQTVSLTTEAEPSRQYSGKVTAINPFVNNSTRSVMVRAQVPNPDFSLRSGLYAEVVQVVGSFQDVLVVPQASLIYTADGAQVLAVSAGRAVPVGVTLVKKIDQARAIVKPREMPKAIGKDASKPASKSSAAPGAAASKRPEIMLKEGLEIVVEGSGKIRPGAKLKTTPYKPVDVSVVTGLPKQPSSGG